MWNKALDLSLGLGQAKPSKQTWEECEGVCKWSQLQERMGSQSIMGTGPGWNTLNQPVSQRYSCSSMLCTTVKTKSDYIMYEYNIVCACVQETNPSYFSPQVKNKPYKPKRAMHLFFRKVQL